MLEMPKIVAARSFVVTVVVFAVLPAPATVVAVGRVTLVVGNSTYAHIGRLPNAENHAADMVSASAGTTDCRGRRKTPYTSALLSPLAERASGPRVERLLVDDDPGAVLMVDGVAAAPAIAAGQYSPMLPPRTAAFLAPPAPQNASAAEASLALDRSTRRLIQQGLRNEGFDPGPPDGLLGPRSRAAIRDWQQSRGASPTGYLTRAEAELLRAAAVPPPAAPEALPPARTVSAGDASALSTAEPPASTSPPPTVATTELDPQNAPATTTQQGTRASAGTGTVRLPPEILRVRLFCVESYLTHS